MSDAGNQNGKGNLSEWGIARVFMGILSLVFFVTHSMFHTSEEHPEHMLWSCNLASVLIGLGLIIRSPTLNAIGLLWLIPGIPIWLYGVATGSRLLFTSCLTHIGGLVISLVGIRLVGFPAGTWWRALLAVVALQHLARMVTPAESNVNMAFRPGPGFGEYSYEVFVVSLGLTMAFAYWAVEASIRRLIRKSRFTNANNFPGELND